jgi:hypothetical protein
LPIPNNIANAGMPISIHCNSIASITNSIRFPASGARNMGEVRNPTSLYFPSISSIWPIARAGVYLAAQASIVCQQHLSAFASNICPGQQHLPTSASNICQHHLPTSAAHCTQSQ